MDLMLFESNFGLKWYHYFENLLMNKVYHKIKLMMNLIMNFVWESFFIHEKWFSFNFLWKISKLVMIICILMLVPTLYFNIYVVFLRKMTDFHQFMCWCDCGWNSSGVLDCLLFGNFYCISRNEMASHQYVFACALSNELHDQ